MISKEGKDFDVILITGEYYDDHPLSPAGVIARVLEDKGCSVGIIEKPLKNEDFLKLGHPKMFFAVTSGSIDSMVNNYTPLKKKRGEDKYSKTLAMPDRAVIVYCNKIKENFKNAKIPIVIGGTEAALRRFLHYDYWSNSLRKSILLDSRADIIVYGSGEKQIAEIVDRVRHNKELKGIAGTCVLSKEVDSSFEILPSFKEASEDKIKFCIMQRMFSNNKNLAQEYDNNYVLQYKAPLYTSKDLDWIYSLPYTRKLNKDSLLKMARFSVVTHRGCLGRCSFCSITLTQGDKIVSRSEKNILDEIKKITKLPGFNGYIEDMGGPSANMYGMDFENGKIDVSHKRVIHLMREARKINGIKKIFVRSGIRYDLALNSKEYIDELSKYHVSGRLKVAPEHMDEEVLALMNKPGRKFKEFVEYYKSINKDKKQSLAYYFMIGHPGDRMEKIEALKKGMESLDADSFQLFTPTPMSVSTCMYYTGLNPYTLKPVKVTYDYNTKKKMKRVILNKDSKKEDSEKTEEYIDDFE